MIKRILDLPALLERKSKILPWSAVTPLKGLQKTISPFSPGNGFCRNCGREQLSFDFHER
jgi:hypothetical protein